MTRSLLAAFQEWLLVRTKARPDVAWPGQVAHLTFADEPDRWGSNGLTEQAREELRQALFVLLDDFLVERERRGLAPICHDYLTWTTAQSWYDPVRFRHVGRRQIRSARRPTLDEPPGDANAVARLWNEG